MLHGKLISDQKVNSVHPYSILAYPTISYGILGYPTVTQPSSGPGRQRSAIHFTAVLGPASLVEFSSK